MAPLEKENADLKKQLEELKKELDTMNRGAKQADHDSATKDVRLNRALEENERLRADADALEELDADGDGLHEVFAAKDAEITALRAKLAELATDLTDKGANVARLTRERDEAREAALRGAVCAICGGWGRTTPSGKILDAWPEEIHATMTLAPCPACTGGTTDD